MNSFKVKPQMVADKIEGKGEMGKGERERKRPLALLTFSLSPLTLSLLSYLRLSAVDCFKG
jgi:hypothetical protein